MFLCLINWSVFVWCGLRLCWALLVSHGGYSWTGGGVNVMHYGMLAHHSSWFNNWVVCVCDFLFFILRSFHQRASEEEEDVVKMVIVGEEGVNGEEQRCSHTRGGRPEHMKILSLSLLCGGHVT